MANLQTRLIAAKKKRQSWTGYNECMVKVFDLFYTCAGISIADTFSARPRKESIGFGNIEQAILKNSDCD